MSQMSKRGKLIHKLSDGGIQKVNTLLLNHLMSAFIVKPFLD